MSSNGIDLSRRFFATVLPLLNERIPDVMTRSAAGLVGEGSECLGLDDEISRDHDWGPAFCLWVPDDLLRSELDRIESVMAALPATFEGHPVRMKRDRRMGRTGPLPLRGFYRRFLGMDHVPEGWREWMSVPEYHLCSCTNGEVFMDEGGEFSAIRNALLEYYPEDVRRKKMAARCMIMAQAGQYNLPRCLQRQNAPTAMLAAARFAEAALSMTFLLNRRFMPFYKWAGRLAETLPVMGLSVTRTLGVLARTRWDSPELGMQAVDAIEKFCTETAEELRRQHLCDIRDNWLWEAGPIVQMSVKDPELRARNVMED
ncbi:DUF4037 domain-containing protein [Dialister succinatiphilus]|uniref:DUF4037 domain-containing protein n=1 Tax=Dialister succinatiphilus TaxID=487173 RepID=UPI0025CD2BD2|nr:DUF4037 domain-containing protein [uncultured Mailhella sp.]